MNAFLVLEARQSRSEARSNFKRNRDRQAKRTEALAEVKSLYDKLDTKALVALAKGVKPQLALKAKPGTLLHYLVSEKGEDLQKYLHSQKKNYHLMTLTVLHISCVRKLKVTRKMGTGSTITKRDQVQN